MLLESQVSPGAAPDIVSAHFNAQNPSRLSPEQLLQTHMLKARILLGGLTDGDQKVGRDFLTMLAKTGCKIIVDPDLQWTAQYVSYSYVDVNDPFPNEVAVNPTRITDIYGFIDSLSHELSHAYEKHSAPALHYSPFNPQSRAMVHPLEWIMLENLCERDAYTNEAWINSLLSKEHPCIVEKSVDDVVTVKEFEALRFNRSLNETMVECAVTALDKLKFRETPDFFFSDYYVNVALTNFSAGMIQRIQHHESGFTFLRLEDRDLYAVGDYNLGPNPFGENSLDPRFKERPRLLPEAQEKLDALCKLYNIPPLERCQTLAEYERMQKPKAELSHDISASSITQLPEMMPA